MSRYANRRFAAFPDDTKKELFAYLYHISTDRGSGEYVLAHVLAPGAFARWPMKKRLGRLDLVSRSHWASSHCLTHSIHTAHHFHVRRQRLDGQHRW